MRGRVEALQVRPIGTIRSTLVSEIAGTRLRIGPIEAIDGTPVADIKPVLEPGEG